MTSAATSPLWLPACACALTLLAGAGTASATNTPPNEAPTKDAALAPAEPDGYWTGPINGPVPDTLSGGTVIDVTELRALLEKQNVALVEVSNLPRRPESLAPGAPWLPTPHVVIPGSVWIPGAGMGAIAPDVDATFRDELARATGNDLDHPIVIYCHERCWLSWNAAKRAISYGYRRVHWYPDGIEGWRAAGLKTSIAEPTTTTDVELH